MTLPRAVVAFRVVYAALALNFLIPAVSYIAAPELAVGTMDRINRLLGGSAFPAAQGELWHMLAVGNVMTLGFLCALLLVDLERFYPALPGLAFLKAFSALYSLVLGFAHDLPAFFAVFLLDGSTTVAMIVFAVRAHRALSRLAKEERPLPLWWRALFFRPERVRAGLVRATQAGVARPTPTMFQLWQGAMRMWARVLLRSDTVGTCSAHPVRATRRARALRFRALRLPALLRERAIAPLDMTGFESSPERVIRHLLAAHHDGPQLVYDLELLALAGPDALARLRDRVRAVVDGTDPRAEWLRDLVVYERYHEEVLQGAERALAGDLGLSELDAEDPDLTLRAFLRWCAFQPATPLAMLRAFVERSGHGAQEGTGHPRAVRAGPGAG